MSGSVWLKGEAELEMATLIQNLILFDQAW